MVFREKSQFFSDPLVCYKSDPPHQNSLATIRRNLTITMQDRAFLIQRHYECEGNERFAFLITLNEKTTVEINTCAFPI